MTNWGRREARREEWREGGGRAWEVAHEWEVMAGSSFGRVHQARSPACSLPCPSLSPSLLTACSLLFPSLPPSLLTSCSLPFPPLPPYIGFSPLSLPPSLHRFLSPFPPSLLRACPSRFPSLPPYMHIVGLHKEAVDQLIDIQVGQQIK
ncbi:hypothetical protein Naga_102743g1, partial [Nannochloropsis gaditana]